MQAECFQRLHNRCHCCRLQKGCSGDLHGIRAGRLHCSCHLLDFAGVCVNLTKSDRLVAARTSRVALSIASARIAQALPSSSMLGQAMLASLAAMPARTNSAVRLATPSAVSAEID